MFETCVHSWLRFDKQFFIHGYYKNGERCSGIIADDWKVTSGIIVAEHRILVIGSEDHHVEDANVRWAPGSGPLTTCIRSSRRRASGFCHGRRPP